MTLSTRERANGAGLRRERAKIAFLSGVMHGDNPRALMMMHALREAGHDVVAVMAQTKAGAASALEGIRHVPVPPPRANFVVGSRIDSLLRAVGDRLRNAWRLYKLIVAERPDVCVCHEPDSWLVALLAKRKLGACVLADVREVYPDRASAFPRPLRAVMAWAVDKTIRVLARWSDGVIHVSAHREDHYRLRHPHSVVVHHRCDPALFAGIQPKRLPGLEGRIVFIHAGPLRTNYAAREILTALESAAARMPDAVLLVVGGSLLDDSLQSIVDRLQRSGQLVLVPYVPRSEVAALILGADVGLALVLPVDVTHRLIDWRRRRSSSSTSKRDCR
jgi:glycosyltransferase involved in cell wall biosynthesis